MLDLYDKVKLIRRESRLIIIRREYKPKDLFITFKPVVVTSLQLNRKFRPCYIILPDSICYSIQFVLPKYYLRVQDSFLCFFLDFYVMRAFSIPMINIIELCLLAWRSC